MFSPSRDPITFHPARRSSRSDVDALIPRRPDPDHVAMKLDSPEAMILHATLMGHYARELERQAVNRQEMATDEDFYDHIQYTNEDLEILAARGQSAVTFNIIQTSINWILGSERRAKKDFRILPRQKEGVKSAERKTQLLMHVRDENRSEYEWSDAFASAVKAGLGWMETAQGSPDDGTIILERSENWRAMLWDSTATRFDLQDARYITRSKWIDLDVAKSIWGNRIGQLDTAARSSSLGFSSLDTLGDDVMDSFELDHFQYLAASGRNLWAATRDRVRVIEMWFRKPIDAKVMRGGQFHGELFDPWSPGHVADLNAERATLSTRPTQATHVALMTDSGFLDLRRSPYRHNRYPFTPIWGYRRSRDGLPYGAIRGIRDVQRDLNRRMAKALHILSAKTILIEQNSVEDPEEVRDEAARPDAMIVFRKGSNPPQITSDTNLAEGQVRLMDIDRAMIQQIGGVTDDNLGRQTNANSGIAIGRRQDQGALATDTFFDNLRRARSIHGEKLLVMIEQFYTEADQIRITDTRGNPDFKPINDGNPENAIAEFKANFVISEEDWRATARQAQAEQFLDLTQKLAATAPQLIVGILDLVVESLDVPKRDEMVKRIRQLTGQADPDADPNNPDEQTIAMQQQKALEQQMAMRQANAALSEQEAKARKTAAEAAKAEGGIGTDYIAALKAAMEAALAIAGAPAVAAAADQVMADAARAAGAATAPQNTTVQPQPAMTGA